MQNKWSMVGKHGEKWLTGVVLGRDLCRHQQHTSVRWDENTIFEPSCCSESQGGAHTNEQVLKMKTLIYGRSQRVNCLHRKSPFTLLIMWPSWRGVCLHEEKSIKNILHLLFAEDEWKVYTKPLYSCLYKHFPPKRRFYGISRKFFPSWEKLTPIPSACAVRITLVFSHGNKSRAWLE